MKAYTIILLALAIATMSACKQQEPPKQNKTNREMLLKGDKSVYGLACDGCNDSVVVLLPDDGSDPVTYNIIDAKRNKKVLGDITIGDWICLLPNDKDKHVADIVVDLDELKGIWCYIVMPKMKAFENMSKKMQARMTEHLSDSIKENFMVPREYGFYLKRHWQSQSVGYMAENTALQEESPVVYPKLGWFKEWHIWNCKFVMTYGTPKFNKDNTVEVTNLGYDTCDIWYLGKDSLVLNDSDGSRSYYRKKSLNDVNVKARAIAEKQAKEAQEAIKETN